LEAIFKILKPSGKLLVIEHVHSKNNLIFQFQKIVNPAWNFLAAGCNLTRNTDETIEKIGFKKLENHYFNMGLQGYFAIYEK
jgi:demethylmenaquinone methyltransferase/2-methoxy-6-polyprenyl-1,4-benzoquinol methylase